MNVTDRLNTFLARNPIVADAAFVAPNATVLGDVVLGNQSSVWYQTVLRGDINFIRIGDGTNLQDGVIVHLADDAPAVVGDWCTVGHRATVHGCRIGNEVLVGMGATVLDHAEVGNRCIIGAHALVPKGMKIPDGSMVLGCPAKIVRPLSEDEQKSLRPWAEKYTHVAKAHAALKRGE